MPGWLHCAAVLSLLLAAALAKDTVGRAEECASCPGSSAEPEDDETSLLSVKLAVRGSAITSKRLQPSHRGLAGAHEFGPNVDIRENSPVDLSLLQQSFSPKVVVVAGLPRAGSTTLTVIAQMWLVLADPNFQPMMSEPWVYYVNPVDYYRAKRQQRSQLVKIHRPKVWVSDVAEVYLTSHRDPVEQLTSQLVSWDSFNCTQVMEKQQELYADAASCCGGMAYDMPMEQLIDDPAKVIMEVGVGMGIGRHLMTDKLLSYTHDIYMRHLPNSSEAGLPDQQDWHSEEDLTAQRDIVAQAVAKDPTCAAWAARGGTFAL